MSQIQRYWWAWTVALGLASGWIGCGDSQRKPFEPEDSAEVRQGPRVFADSSLEASVREALQKPAGPLTPEDLLWLTQLVAPGRGIGSLHGIEQLAELTVLDLADNRVRDLSPLSSLSKLRFLDLENNRISDISPLSALAELEFAALGFNAVADISPLTGLRRLRSVGLEGNPLSPASRTTRVAALEARGVQVSLGQPREGESPSPETTPVVFADPILETAVRDAAGKSFADFPRDLTGADVQSVSGLVGVGMGISDLRGLEAMTGLYSLNLRSNQIADVSPLASLTRLAILNLADNQIRDISALSALTVLTFLNVGGNQISDLSALSGLTGLTSVTADRNQIRDLSPLAGLGWVSMNLDHNQITDISPLVGLPRVKKVSLVGNPLDEASRDTHIPALQGRGVDVVF